MIDIEKYSLVKLPEVSKILSSAGFIRKYGQGANHSQKAIFIYAPEVYDPTKIEFMIQNNDVLLKGFAIFPDIKRVNIFYLTCILNAYVSWSFITEGNMEKKATITIKKLSNIVVRVLPDYLQNAVAYLYYLMLDLKIKKEERSDNPYLDYWMSVYREIQNAIALGLVMPQMYREYEIDMLGSWYDLIGRCTIEHPDISFDQLKEELEKELLTPQNEVVGNMNKLRVVMRTIIEQVTDKV